MYYAFQLRPVWFKRITVSMGFTLQIRLNDKEEMNLLERAGARAVSSYARQVLFAGTGLERGAQLAKAPSLKRQTPKPEKPAKPISKPQAQKSQVTSLAPINETPAQSPKPPAPSPKVFLPSLKPKADPNAPAEALRRLQASTLR